MTIRSTTDRPALYWESLAGQRGVLATDLDSVRPALQVRFFGFFEVLYDNVSLPLGHNGRALNILKYLLTHRKAPVSRDFLMDWLWPHSAPRKARWSLNSAVYDLRRTLDQWPGKIRAAEIISHRNGYYSLSPEIQFYTDTEAFDEHRVRARRLEMEQDIEESVKEREKAVALYRDDYLVENLYEDWTMIERERLLNTYLEMLSQLAGHYFEAGRFRDSIHRCYQTLHREPCHEDIYRLLMRCYARLGLWSRAIDQYRLCEQILGQQYGATPSPETKHIYRELLENSR